MKKFNVTVDTGNRTLTYYGVSFVGVDNIVDLCKYINNKDSFIVLEDYILNKNSIKSIYIEDLN